MAERHRGYGRDFERRPPRRDDDGGGRDRGPRDRRPGPPGGRDFGGPPGGRGFGGPGGGRDFGGPPGGRDFNAPPQYREHRPPAPPVEAEDTQEVDADLAIALLETAARLTEIVGTNGLPEDVGERRQAVLETFQTIYFSILESVTGGDEEEDDEEGGE